MMRPPQPQVPPPLMLVEKHLRNRKNKRNGTSFSGCMTNPLLILAIALLIMVIIIGWISITVLSEDSALHRFACAHEHYMGEVPITSNQHQSQQQQQPLSIKLVDTDKHRNALRKEYDDYVKGLESIFSKYNNIVHIITHTHWDREWYLPFERFRRKFVWIVDQVLDTFHKRPNEMHHFHMDGQVVPYIDYLEIKPDRKSEILDLINSGKLSIGPWYTAPDEFLASAEALVRNLLNGYRHTRRLGVEWLPMGYGADNFGHISQLPQIYSLFDIETAIQARGVSSGAKMEFLWRGADSTEIFVVYMKHWYCHAEGSPRASDTAFIWFNRKIMQSFQTSATKHLLLMNGCDHTPMDVNILDNIKLLQSNANVKKLHNRYMIQSDFNIYVKQVKQGLKEKPKTLTTVTGEQRVGIAYLSHIASNKITQKQANWRCQSLLEHYVEPLRTLAWAKNWLPVYENGFIWYAWENILKSHAHDSIGGCSVPEVHADVDHRFKICQEVAETLLDDALQALMVHTDLKATLLQKSLSGGRKLMVINTMIRTRSYEPVIIRMDGVAAGKTIKVVDALTDTDIPAEVLETHSRIWDFTLPKSGFRRPWTGGRTYIGVLATVRGMGTRVYDVKITPGDKKDAVKKLDTNVLKNEFLHITIDKNVGTISIKDLKTDVEHVDMNVLEIQGDNGDEYNAHPSGVIKHIKDGKLSKIVDGPLGQRCHVTGILEAPNGKGMHVHIHYYLGAKARQIDIRVTVRNRNNGFRLRSVSSIGLCDGGSRQHNVDCHFDVVTRNQNPTNLAQAQQDFVTFVCANKDKKKKHVLTFANRGLPEYQHINGKYALTLLRATGRMGDWGTFPTSPSSQEHGIHSFEYSIIIADDELSGNALGRQFNVPMVGVTPLIYPGIIQSRPLYDISHTLLHFLEKHKKAPELKINTFHNPADHSPRTGGTVPPPARPYTSKDALPFDGPFMSLEPSNILVLSAMKLSERNGKTLLYGPYEQTSKIHEDHHRSVIIRWYNPTNSGALAKLSVSWPVVEAYVCNLKEERVSKLKHTTTKNGGFSIEFQTNAKKIITVELVPKRSS